MFSSEFVEQLGYGKYTNWVLSHDFSEKHLLCLLAIIGEIGASAPELLRLLFQNRSRLSGAERSVLAIAALHCIVRGERFDRYEWSRRLSSGGRMRREIGDLPEAARVALGAALPGAAWEWVMVIAEGYELDGKDAAGQRIYAYFSPDGGLIQVGAERRWGESADPSILPATLAQAAALSGRTRWAVERAISENHLQCLLWLVGEFEARSHIVLRILHEHREELAEGGRVLVILDAMCRMAAGIASVAERFDVDELGRRVARGRAHLEFDDLPDAVRARLNAASPGMRWTHVLMTPEGFDLGGKDASGRFIEPSVSRSGGIVFRLNVAWESVPAAVADAVTTRFPDFRMPWAYARLAADGTIAAYEIVHFPKVGRTQRIAVGLDGTEVRMSTD